MKANELRKLTVDELRKKVDEMKMKLLRLRFKQKVAGLDNPMEIRNLRRDIARALTIIREKELRGEK